MLDWLRERWKCGLTEAMRHRSRRFERQYEQELAYAAQLRNLPIESARRESLRLLAATALVEVTPAREPPPPVVATLGPELRDFFAHYRRVETANGGKYIDVGAVEPCGWRPGWIEIGSCDGHVHLMARAGDDAVAEIADDVDADAQVHATFPSIHHWLLALHHSEALAEADDS
jgi:hypothetical protein